ncbi:hypothetical protein ACJX0J_026244, partial [Zea mays]
TPGIITLSAITACFVQQPDYYYCYIIRQGECVVTKSMSPIWVIRDARTPTRIEWQEGLHLFITMMMLPHWQLDVLKEQHSNEDSNNIEKVNTSTKKNRVHFAKWQGAKEMNSWICDMPDEVPMGVVSGALAVFICLFVSCLFFFIMHDMHAPWTSTNNDDISAAIKHCIYLMPQIAQLSTPVNRAVSRILKHRRNREGRLICALTSEPQQEHNIIAVINEQSYRNG